jgi:tRNA U34 5-carboxymethylaminomethyl modifying GTPase MnmE/TrmE
VLEQLIDALDRGERPSCVAGPLEALLARSRAAFRLGEPLRLLIAGRPNTGKSTLFNRLVEDDRVLVSPRAGTTRDLIIETIAIGGFPIELIDSAGLRASPGDIVEAAAIDRVATAAPDAVLHLLAPPWTTGEEDRALEERWGDRVLTVHNFADLAGDRRRAGLWISSLTGTGLDELRAAVAGRAIGPHDEAIETCDAPFTRAQIDLLGSSLAAARRPSPSLDAMREPLVICLRSSWPDSLRTTEAGPSSLDPAGSE